MQCNGNFKNYFGRHEILTGLCPLAFNVVLMSDFSRFLLCFISVLYCILMMFNGPTVIGVILLW